MCITQQCLDFSPKSIVVHDVGDATGPTAWLTLRRSSFRDGRRLFLCDSKLKPDHVVVEFRAPDHSIRVGEFPRRSLPTFLGLLAEGEITTAFEVCEGEWLIHPERKGEFERVWVPEIHSLMPAEACTELGV